MAKKNIIFVVNIFVFLLLINVESLAENSRVLSWQDLVPKQKIQVNPLEGLDLQLRLDIEYIAIVRYQFRTGQISEVHPDYEYALEIEYKLKLDKIDVERLVAEFDDFLDEIERQNKLAVKELDGSFVRIPGYVMPLETSGTAIDEFMLVPTIGACIHTPVPPANQMVFVEVKESFYAQELYEPVWVTGLMKLEYEKNSLTYFDGVGTVESAYIIQDAVIEPYED